MSMMTRGEGGTPTKGVTLEDARAEGVSLFEKLCSMINASMEMRNIISSISDKVGTSPVPTETSKEKEARNYDRGSITGEITLLSDVLDECYVLVHDLYNRI